MQQAPYAVKGMSYIRTRPKPVDRLNQQPCYADVAHIEESKTTGTKLEELCQVLPALPMSQVQSLLKTLKRLGKAHPIGRRKAGLWFPGPGLAEASESENGV